MSKEGTSKEDKTRMRLLRMMLLELEDGEKSLERQFVDNAESPVYNYSFDDVEYMEGNTAIIKNAKFTLRRPSLGLTAVSCTESTVYGNIIFATMMMSRLMLELK